VCLDSSNVDSQNFVAPVSDTTLINGVGKTLTLRWFLNYNSNGDDVPLRFPTTDQTDFTLLPSVVLDAAGRQTNIVYTVPSWSSGSLHLEVLGPGVYTLEEVISDGFDPNPNTAPVNRAPLQGSYVTSYKWAINYVAGTCSTP
jgi:hypothetical protein